ncbi:MAG: isochorismatase family protein [Cyclobacteriaceae bacterium]
MRRITRPHQITVIFLILGLFGNCSSKQEEKKSSDHLIQFTGTKRVKNGTEWQPKEEKKTWKAKETAIIICDMWDKHWCKGATERVGKMAPRLNELIKAGREKGVFIVHAPSDVVDFYDGTPQREKLKNVQITASASAIPRWYPLDSLKESNLPIDDSDGGCDCSPKCENYRAWKKQTDALEIAEGDGVSDSGNEIVSYFQNKGIKNVIVTGVHTNMCVLGRSFGIRGQTAAGMKVVLARDLTDAMYNHEMAPFVSHEKGTQKVIEHIEKYWSPTVSSADLINGLQ